MKLKELVDELRSIARYTHNVCDDDGYTDEWDSISQFGDYVLWDDVAELISKYEGKTAIKNGK